MSVKRKRGPGRPSKYPFEFQRDAVAMVLVEGRPIAEVARSLGVNEGTLGNWVNRERQRRSEAPRVWWRLQPLRRMESCRSRGSTRMSCASAR